MPRAPTSFENYARFAEYRRRVQGGRALLSEEGSDLGANFFRPALPGPFNYTPAEFSNNFLQVDPLPGHSFVDDLTIPRNLLQLADEPGLYTSAGTSLSAETAAASVGVETSEFGPEIAIPASITAYLAFTHPKVAKEIVKTLALSSLPVGVNGFIAAAQELEKRFQGNSAGQASRQTVYTDPQTINHGNTYR